MNSQSPAWRFHPEERRARPSRATTRFEEDGRADLERVLHEISELMHAEGALLTMHPGDAPAVLIHAEQKLRDSGQAAACLNVCQTVRHRFDDNCCIWRRHGEKAALFLMPIDRTAGHSQLMVGALFHDPTDEQRTTAERLYRERRPFAVGFFHLWQRNRLLEQRARAWEAVLNQTVIGVILIDRSGQIAFVNDTATEVLNRCDGLCRTGSSLRAMHLADGIHLQAALNHAMADAEQQEDSAEPRVPMLAFRRKNGQPLVASILPASAIPIEPSDVAAIMYLVDPGIDTRRMLSPLCRLYGLSPVETSLVCLLASGQQLTAAARGIHVKEQTARSYLKSIFIKTGTNRQADLIVLMLSSMIRMRDGITYEPILINGAARTPSSDD